MTVGIGAMRRGMRADPDAVADDSDEDLNALGDVDLVSKGGVVAHSRILE
jgi:hypothetical protein